MSFSANDIVEVDSVTVKKNQPYAEFKMLSNELGTTNLEYQIGGFEGTTAISSHTTDPAVIHLSFPKNVISKF